MRGPYLPLFAFIRARLSPEGFLGLHLTLGVLIFVGAAWLFSAIFEEVFNHESLILFDFHVAAWLHEHASPALTTAMTAISYFGAPAVTGSIALATGLLLLWRRHGYRVLALVLAVPGGMLLNVLIKYVVHRHRPNFDHPLMTLTGYSFPSGHAMAATVLYGVLAAFVVWSTKDRRQRLLAVLVAGSLIALVCFSRIYLGVHYISDVLAGIFEGVAWLALCLTGIDTLRRHRLRRRTPLSATSG